jgi:uncharacterized membrane protein YedE/YeeE
MKEIFEEFFPIIILGIIVGVISLGVYYGYNSFVCSSKAKEMGLDCKYSLFAGCMINPRGRWIPLESYRVI